MQTAVAEKKSLFEINQEILRLYEESIDYETGEVKNLDALDKIKELQVDMQEVLKTLRWVYKKMQIENELGKKEKDRINQVQRCLKNNMARLEEYVLKNAPHKTDKILGISFRHYEQSLDIDENILKAPKGETTIEGIYRKKVTYELDMDTIEEKLKAGEKIEGARLIPKDTVSFGKVEM